MDCASLLCDAEVEFQPFVLCLYPFSFCCSQTELPAPVRVADTSHARRSQSPGSPTTRATGGPAIRAIGTKLSYTGNPPVLIRLSHPQTCVVRRGKLSEWIFRIKVTKRSSKSAKLRQISVGRFVQNPRESFEPNTKLGSSKLFLS